MTALGQQLTIATNLIVSGERIASPHSKMKYKCQICEREIDDFAGLAHIKAEEYIIELIKKAHPEWKKDKGTCNKCLEYYRKLVKEAEI